MNMSLIRNLKGWSVVLLLGLSACGSGTSEGIPTKGVSGREPLVVKPLAEGLFLHTTYLRISEAQYVGCNGIIYVHAGEALVVDAPSYDSLGDQLIHYIEDSLQARVVGLVANHFHIDALGGLEAFHRSGIPTYGQYLTQQLAAGIGNPVPQVGFDSALTLAVGGVDTYHFHPGPAHTIDGVVSYFSTVKALYGGCQIKSMGAGKGNLADADTLAWPATMAFIQHKLPHLTYIIPGHGPAGGPELLTYTHDLFAQPE